MLIAICYYRTVRETQPVVDVAAVNDLTVYVQLVLAIGIVFVPMVFFTDFYLTSDPAHRKLVQIEATARELQSQRATCYLCMHCACTA